ncbi:MAG: hypothetical protein GY707_06345 [Desulfobacteraceae bacterium]|nr:hypothetical protein [Desulfobacteraceae bacterium]
MLKKDLINRSPICKILNPDSITQVKFGAVLSRAGVGKTQFLVQIAMTRLLNNEKIIHISLNDPMDKINLRYIDSFNNLVESIGYVDPLKAKRLWEDINQLKVGIAYNESSFDPKKIYDYLNSFKKADSQIPTILLIDGLNFESDLSSYLDQLQTISENFNIAIWFSIRTHREESLCSDGYPIQFENVKDRFDKALVLNPKDNKIEAKVLKNGDDKDRKFLLDPATMMPE